MLTLKKLSPPGSISSMRRWLTYFARTSSKNLAIFRSFARRRVSIAGRQTLEYAA